MKVNFNQSFKDFRGNDIGILISDEVGKLLFNVSTSGNNPLNADEKYMAYKLCSRICNGSEVELSSEEAAFIVKLCGEHLTAGGYGQIKDLIDK